MRKEKIDLKKKKRPNWFCFLVTIQHQTKTKKRKERVDHHWLKFSVPLELAVAANFRFFFCKYSLSSSLGGAACFAVELKQNVRFCLTIKIELVSTHYAWSEMYFPTPDRKTGVVALSTLALETFAERTVPLTRSSFASRFSCRSRSAFNWKKIVENIRIRSFFLRQHRFRHKDWRKRSYLR